MTAHVAVPNVTGTPQVPATLSQKILTDLLRGSLDFKGLVITDALEMGGIANSYWSGMAAIRALEAGADILLLPADADVAINEVERAVKRGDITEVRIDESVKKILAAKGQLGLHRKRTVATKRISEIVATPQNTGHARELADRSITVLRNEPPLLPLDPASYPRIFSLALTPDLESSPAAVFQSEMRRRFPLIRTHWANARMSDEESATIERALTESDVIVCSVMIRLSSGQNAAPIPESQRAVFQKLLAANKPLIWVAFGTPYIFQMIPRAGTHVCTFSYADASQIAAAKAIAGEIEVTGRMPVSIPGYSRFGDGLTIPKEEMRLQPETAREASLLKSDSNRISVLLASLAENGTTPGAQLIVGHKSKILFNQSAGRIGYTEDSRASLDTIYDISYFSRIVGIASGVMLAADAGSLILQTPVEDYLPEVRGTDGGKLLLQDLLLLQTERSMIDREGPDSIQNRLKTIVARSTGISYESLIAERLFKPLGMKSAFFKPPRNFRGTVARSSEPQKAELFCSAQHLAIFAQMLLNRGVYSHRRYLKLETSDMLTSVKGLWAKPSNSDWTGRIFSPNAYGYNSACGSLLWIDPAKKLLIILLTSGRAENTAIPEAQRIICESIISSIPN